MMINIKTRIRQCSNCSLRCNQTPLLDNNANASVFWVGLSAVRTDNADFESPLSPSTNTGKLITEIELLSSSNNFYRTNIVKCLPLNNNKIRYPTKNEMKSCYHNLELEINVIQPKLVFLLGKQVSNFIADRYNIEFNKLDESFNYTPIQTENMILVQIHHPSYILVYKRKKIDSYRRKISQLINCNSLDLT